MINVFSKNSLVNEEIWKLVSDNEDGETPDLPDKLGVLYVTLMYIKKFVGVYERLPSAIEIFHHTKKALVDLQLKMSCHYPQIIVDKLSETVDVISCMKLKKEILTVQVSNRPKPLKLYEPLIEEE